MSDTALLSVIDLACRRGGRPVFEGVSFSLLAGEGLVVTGANGAGKSSLLRVLAGLTPPAGGSLQGPGPVKTRYVGHHNALKPGFTVAENIETVAQMYGTECHTQTALSAFALDPLKETMGRYLSAGQKRRVALARLIASPAPLWLLDEPATGLDAASVGLLESAIARHLDSGGSAVIASHGGFDVPHARDLRLGLV